MKLGQKTNGSKAQDQNNFPVQTEKLYCRYSRM